MRTHKQIYVAEPVPLFAQFKEFIRGLTYIWYMPLNLSGINWIDFQGIGILYLYGNVGWVENLDGYIHSSLLSVILQPNMLATAKKDIP